MPSAEMIGIMAPYSVAAAVLLVLIACVAFGKKPVSEFSSIDGSGIEQNVLAPNSDQPRPDEIHDDRLWRRLWRLAHGSGHRALFDPVCLLAVSDFIPLWAMCVIVVVDFPVGDRRVFRNIDWGLPLTFCMFFIFIGNMRRVPESTSWPPPWWGRIRWKCPWCPASSSPTCRPRCCCRASARRMACADHRYQPLAAWVR